jgi:hypothetical protein
VHADRNYVEIRMPRRSYLLRSTLGAMQDRLGTTVIDSSVTPPLLG